MECPYCKSCDIRSLKIYITKPIGAKKYKCFECYKSFITHKTENNNLIQIPCENNKT